MIKYTNNDSFRKYTSSVLQLAHTDLMVEETKERVLQRAFFGQEYKRKWKTTATVAQIES